MSRRKYDIRNLVESSEGSFELDLAPMLALMVTLIPIMLLSTVFVKVMVVETALPQVVQQAIQKDDKDKNRKVSLSLKMSPQWGFRLLVKRGSQTQTIRVPQKQGQWDLEGLQAKLVKIKLSHPTVYKLDLEPDGKVPYEDIVKVMDEARTIKDQAVKVTVENKETKEKVQTDAMFPNVVFANVVGG